MACNEVRFLDAERLLLCYSMIEARGSIQGSGDHSIHPVVHRWTSHIQDDKGKRLFLRQAMTVVGFSVPDSKTKDYWELQRRLLPHVERCSGGLGSSRGASAISKEVISPTRHICWTSFTRIRADWGSGGDVSAGVIWVPEHSRAV